MRNPGRKRDRASTLTPRKAKFVTAYLANGGNSCAAARTAGYGSATTISSARLRYDPIVAAEIEKRAKRFNSKKAQLKATEVIGQLACIVRSNVADFVEPDGEGSFRLKAIELLTRDQLAAVSEIDMKPVTIGEGKHARPAMRIKLKFWDKNAAANTLCRHFGLFNEGDKGGATDRETIFTRAVSAVDRLVERVIAEGEARLDAGPVPERSLLPVEVYPPQT